MRHGYQENHHEEAGQDHEEDHEEGDQEGGEEAGKVRRTSRQVYRKVAEDLRISRRQVRQVVEAFVAQVAQGIAEGEEVFVEGLGTFQARKVRTEACVYPKDGQGAVRTKASVRVGFRRGTALGRVLRDRYLTPEERGR